MRRRSSIPTIPTIPCLVVLVLSAACAGSDGDGTDESEATNPTVEMVAPETPATAEAPDDQQFPDVIAAAATPTGDTWTFEATLSSPYDTPQRYADAWRLLTPDGSVLGVRELAHDHADEQPFTRSLTGVVVPADVDVVVVEGRDSTNGWGGETATITLVAP